MGASFLLLFRDSQTIIPTTNVLYFVINPSTYNIANMFNENIVSKTDTGLWLWECGGKMVKQFL
jgi:hypothetical protein